MPTGSRICTPARSFRTKSIAKMDCQKVPRYARFTESRNRAIFYRITGYRGRGMSDLSEVASKIADWNYIRSTRRLEYYVPYEYQLKFHNALGFGTTRPSRQRLLMAGNKVGKTLCSAFEVAIHATGRYPSWWRGSRLPYAPATL